jgi:hypothetical protein
LESLARDHFVNEFLDHGPTATRFSGADSGHMDLQVLVIERPLGDFTQTGSQGGVA